MSTERFDDEQISHMIAFFADRLNLVFAHFFCTIEFNSDKDFSALPTQENLKDARILGLRTIRGACLHTTLIALRDLDDVLTPRKPKSKFLDDFKISDFGYARTLSFLSTSERKLINQVIAHSTLIGADLSHRWDVFELATKCVRQSVTFLEWLEKHSRDPYTALWCRTGIQSTYDFVATKLKEIRIVQTI